MNLTVNGKPYQHNSGQSLTDLLTDMQAVPEQVAVMLNDSVIKKSDYSTTQLNEGDSLEIMMMVGGGS